MKAIQRLQLKVGKIRVIDDDDTNAIIKGDDYKNYFVTSNSIETGSSSNNNYFDLYFRSGCFRL